MAEDPKTTRRDVLGALLSGAVGAAAAPAIARAEPEAPPEAPPTASTPQPEPSSPSPAPAAAVPETPPVPGAWEPGILELFLTLKKGGQLPFDKPPEEQVVTIDHDALRVTPGPAFAGSDPAELLARIPDGAWMWVGPLDERAALAQLPGGLGDMSPVELAEHADVVAEVRHRHPGLARTAAPPLNDLRQFHEQFDASRVRGSVPHLFSGDGLISQVRFAGGRVTYRRRRIVTERLALEADKRDKAARGDKQAERWLVRQEETRLEAIAPDTEAGMREAANTALYPFQGMVIACFEAGRPYALDPTTLATLGPVGGHGPAASSPWFHEANWAHIDLEVLLGHNPESVGSGPTYPVVPNTAHPGVTLDGDAMYFSYFTYAVPDRSREEVIAGFQSQPGRSADGYTHTSKLFTVVWSPGGDTAEADKPGTGLRRVAHTQPGPVCRAGIGWGTHQCWATEHWFVAMDSGFPTESYQYKQMTETSSPPLSTVLWFSDRRALDARAGQPCPADLRAYRVPVEPPYAAQRGSAARFQPQITPTIHGYGDWADDGGERVVLWLLGNRYFDASEWVRSEDDQVRAGSPKDFVLLKRAPWQVLGFPTSDQTPHMFGPASDLPGIEFFGKRIYRLEIDPGASDPADAIKKYDVIPCPRGTILAAEPTHDASGRLPALWWVSQGTWPETNRSITSMVWELEVEGKEHTPAARQNAALFRTTREGKEIDRIWVAERPTWLYGLALAPREDDPGEGFLFAAGIAIDETGAPVEQLLIFDTERVPDGPMLTITARDGEHLWLGFGIHGTWMDGDALG